ncbi:hypothetical protein ACFWAP_00515 [Streptomyces goshikiensis]|uniref:hypothetical protein n=1 Tax=Streptomyces goshikiensis TaxID=1942 RepID=UPI003665498A
MPETCTHTYRHSFDVHAFLPRHQIRHIERSGLTLILQQMRVDGVEPDWASLDLRVDWPAARTGRMVHIHTTISALKGEN